MRRLGPQPTEDGAVLDQHVQPGEQQMLGPRVVVELPGHAFGQRAANGVQQAFHGENNKRAGHGLAVGKVLVERADADASAAGDRVGGEAVIAASA